MSKYNELHRTLAATLLEEAFQRLLQKEGFDVEAHERLYKEWEELYELLKELE